MAEGELRIKSDSIEKTTSAITALIARLEELDGKLDKTNKRMEEGKAPADKVTAAITASNIARKKAKEMLDLHQQGLNKLSQAYAEEQGAIKAREIAAKKNISLESEEYQQLLKNVQATELATAASKQLALQEAEKARQLTASQKAAALSETTTTKKTAAELAADKALKSSNISRETSVKLLKLEEQGLDKLSDEYAEQKGAILGEQQARLKNIKAGSDEYKQIIRNAEAKEKATTATKKLKKAQDDAKKGATSFTNSLDDMAKQAALVDGPLGGIASRITTLSAILKSTGGLGGAIAFTGVGIGLALFTQQLAKGIGVAIESEVTMKALEAQVRSTGGAAGYTADQLDKMARSIAMSTLDSTAGVRSSIQSLLSYTNISSSMFEDVVRKSQDAAIVTGKSTKTVVAQLGKVLDDPINNLETLKELRLKIAPEEKESIRNLQSEGRLYEAQTIILDKLSIKYGDVAREQANATLAGDLDTLSQNWEELFETLGSGTNGPLRNLVQGLNSAVEAARGLAETGIETGIREARGEFEAATKSSEKTAKYLEELEKELSALDKTAGDISFGDKVGKTFGQARIEAEKFFEKYTLLATVADGEVESERQQDFLLTEKEKKYQILLKLKEEAIAKQKMQNGGVKEYIPLLTDAQFAAKKLADAELEKQKELTSVLLEVGDTRSKVYRDAKAGQDALAEAQKRGFDFDKEDLERVLKTGEAKLGYQEKELKAIYKNKIALSDLTEQRVSYNTSYQKTKSLQSQQSGIEREIALYKATTTGLMENSDAYIHLAASLKTANAVKQMGGDITSEQLKTLQQENYELLKAQKNQQVLNALKASDSNSSNSRTLDRQIALQKAVTEGTAKNSKEYIFLEEKIKAVNVATERGLSVDSEEYKQLLLSAEGIAAKRSELQKYQDLAESGIVFNSSGQAQIEGSLKQLTSSLPEELVKLDDLVDPDAGISQELVDKLKENLKESFNDEKNSILLPLGFFVDSEGSLQTADELNLLQEELRVKQAELKTLWEEEDLLSDEQYYERKKQLALDYEGQIGDAKVDAWKATADYKNLMLSKETADQAASGLETLSVVAGNNKKLAKMAKAASIFSASASLVDALAEASAQPFPTNVPLYAKAFAQGTQLISMAKGLNEPSFAFGGVDIQGAGTGRSDSIKANIARGESVMTAPATSRYKDTLQRMNAGLPVKSGGGGSFTSAPSITIQGDASERTVGLIQASLRDYEERVQQIAQGVSLQSIQEENEVGGFLNPI